MHRLHVRTSSKSLNTALPGSLASSSSLCLATSASFACFVGCMQSMNDRGQPLIIRYRLTQKLLASHLLRQALQRHTRHCTALCCLPLCCCCELCCWCAKAAACRAVTARTGQKCMSAGDCRQNDQCSLHGSHKGVSVWRSRLEMLG